MDFLSLLQEKEVLLFDGALGTELMAHGLKPGTLPDSWNVEKPEVIRDLFTHYYTVGSDMVQTATFRANGVALRGYGIQNQETLLNINKSAGELLKSVCPPNKCAIGDIGPSGEFLPPVGKVSANELEQGFRLQAQSLDQYIDAWHLETFSDLQEMKIAINAIQSVSDKPIIGSITYKKTPKGFFTVMGNSIDECISELIDKVSVIGSNCTLGSDDFVELTKAMRDITSDFPISIKPNAGQPTLDDDGRSIYKQTSEDFAEDLRKILEFDVQIIGGCCGTTPGHIKLLRKVLDEFEGVRI